jgi:16S rRNA (guanine527-N7)-methyltransferase
VRNGSPQTTPPQDRDPLPTYVNDLPPLPQEYWDAIRDGLGSISLDVGSGDVGPGDVGPGDGGTGNGGAVSESELQVIGDHVRLLLAWNEKINLSGIRAPDAIAVEHVLDSLTALPILRRAGVEEFLDIGSGGGFPGLPLAVALPARRALLVESVGKKARFLATAVDAIGVRDPVSIAATRAETLTADPRHRGYWQAVTARAIAEMGELVELALPLLRVGGLLVAWKRRPAEEELARAEGAIHQLHGRLIRLEPVTVPGLEDHVLAVVQKTAETPAQFPRDSALRRRRPL